MKPVVLRPAAEREIQEIQDWYNARRLGLGEEFLEEVEWTLTLIEQHPKAYAIFESNVR